MREWFAYKEPPPVPIPPGRFVWSAPGLGGMVSYAVRQDIKSWIGPGIINKSGLCETAVDLDIVPGRGAHFTDQWHHPDRGHFSLFLTETVHQLHCLADGATTDRLPAGTQLRFCGDHEDMTEGFEASLFEIISGPRAGDFALLGEGGRYGDPAWIAGCTLLSAGHPALSDLELAETMLARIRRVAIANGAPGIQT